jgi:integrase
VDATSSKHKREDVLPLRPATAEELKQYFAMKLPTVPAFPMWRQCGSNMLREDLKVAKIDYVDEQGRYVDFHALRHTFLTNLAMSGVHPKVAQSLARHSDINLTMNRYTHILLETQSDALKALPNLVNASKIATSGGR